MKWALLVVALIGCTRASGERVPGVHVLGTSAAVTPHAQDEPAEGHERITGKVVDETGAPVSGATVRAVARKQTRTTTSGADGTFTFEKLPARMYAVSALADDLYASHETVAAAVDHDPVIVRMRRGCTVTVHVVDAGTRAPVANAEIEVEPQKARTGPDGSAALRGVVPSSIAFLAVHADGYAAGARPLDMPASAGCTSDEAIELERGAEVRGVVRGPGGKPVAGAVVTYLRGIARARNDEAVTAADGTWRYPALAAGNYVFLVEGGGYAPYELGSVSLDGKTPRDDVSLTMPLGAQIVGDVYDSHGRPVEGATVTARGQHSLGAHGVSDAHGHFELFGIEPGKVAVHATYADDASPEAELTVEADRRTQVRIDMTRTTIEGVALDDQGALVPGAELDLVGDSHDESFAGKAFSVSSRFASAVADEHGRFRFRGLPTGSYRISAWRTRVDKLSRIRTKGMTVASGATNVQIRMTPGATVTGRVLLDGHPVRDFDVALAMEMLANRPIATRAVHAANGAFTLADVGGGKWSVVVSGADFARTIVDVDLTAGQTAALGDIVVDRGVDVHGRVTDAHGPVAGATVAIATLMDMSIPGATRGRKPDYVATTAADGTYMIPHVARPASPVLHWQIAATLAGHGISQPRELAPGESSVDLAVSPPGAIDGHVAHPPNHNFAVVFARRGKLSVASTTLMPGGEFSFPELAPGTYTLSLQTDPTGEPERIDVTVASGRHVAAEFTGGH